MEQLNHPNLIRMLETIDSPKRIHIVMEFAGGYVCHCSRVCLRCLLAFTVCVYVLLVGVAVVTCVHT